MCGSYSFASQSISFSTGAARPRAVLKTVIFVNEYGSKYREGGASYAPASRLLDRGRSARQEA